MGSQTQYSIHWVPVLCTKLSRVGSANPCWACGFRLSNPCKSVSLPAVYIQECESDSAILAEFVEERLSKSMLSWWESSSTSWELSCVSRTRHSIICWVNQLSWKLGSEYLCWASGQCGSWTQQCLCWAKRLKKLIVKLSSSIKWAKLHQESHIVFGTVLYCTVKAAWDMASFGIYRLRGL